MARGGGEVKKKFKVLINDAEKGVYYSIWNVGTNGVAEYCYARFYGKYCRQFAYQHCRILNLFPEKEKP